MKYAMIEADKMLNLRRYLLTILRANAKSHVARPLHSASSPHDSTLSHDNRGYVFRYAQHRYVRMLLHSRLSYASAIARTRTFGTTTIAESSIDDIDQKLMSLYDDVKHERVSVDRLREVIKLLNENEHHQLDSNTGVLLLKYCGDLPSAVNSVERQNLVDRVWRHVLRNRDALTLGHYNTLLEVHARNANSVDPTKFLVGMSVEPDESTYRLLLDAAVKANNAKHVRNAMSAMEERNVRLDEDAFGALIWSQVANGNVAEAEHTLTLVKNAELPTNKLYTKLACGYAMLGDIPNLAKILNDEPQSDASLLRIIRALSASENGRHIPVVVNFLTASTSTINSEIQKTLTKLVRSNHSVDAHTVINCLALNEATVDHARSLVSSFLNELVMANAPIEDIVRYANDFVDSGYEPLALSQVAEVGLKLGRENLCLAIFKTMREKDMEIRPHYYWPLLATACANEGESKVYTLVESMVKNGVEVDSDTLINYVFPFVNTMNPTVTLQRLQLKRIPSFVLYTPMLSYLLSHKRLQDAIALCKNARMKLHYRELIKPLVRAYLATRNVESCVTLLTIFTSGHEFVGQFLYLLLNGKHSTFYAEDLQLLLEAFKVLGAKITPRDATILKDKLVNIDLGINQNADLRKAIDHLVDGRMENSSLSLMLHPKYMNSKELACHLAELKSKGFPIKTTLRRMLEQYCNENNLKKVEEIKREIDANEVPWTPGMKMFLFELYLKHNKLKEAEALLSELRDASDPTFLIDNNKILMFAIALVEANRPKSAFDVIEKYTKFYTRRDTQHYCHKLLSALARSEYHAYTQNMLLLLVERNYCKINVELLRPLVAIPLERNDIPSAMNVFMECVNRYNKTPLMQELLTTLLRERDNSKLPEVNRYIQQVYNTIVNFRGPEVATTLLAIGLATLNKTDELRSILKEQNISMNSLIHFHDYAQKSNKIDVLWKIFMGTPSMSNLDQIILCEMLLTSYSKVSDCDGALELWKMMAAKNVEPTEQFKQRFRRFLLSNKVPLPAGFEAGKNEVNVSD